MKLLQRKSVFKRYLITYIGLAITVCAVLGLVLTLISANSLNMQERESLQKRLASAGDDFCQQLDILQRIGTRISYNILYQPVYLQQSTINEMQMLENFSLLSSTSIFSDACYLYYADSNTVYSMSSKMPLTIFLSQYSPLTQPSDFSLLLDTKAAFFHLGNEKQLFYKQKIVFNRYSHGNYAYLLFRIDQQAIGQRYQELFRFNGTPHLETEGDVVLIDGNLNQSNLQYAFSYNGNQYIWTVHDDLGMLATSLAEKMLAFLAGISLIFTGISAYLAWKNYSPVKRLAQKVGTPTVGGNEFQMIAAAIDNVLQQNSASLSQLTDSLQTLSKLRASLQQQILLLILSGEYDFSLKQRMAEAGLDFSGERFCAAHILFNAAVAQEELCHLLASQSTDDTRIYPVTLNGQQGWAILMIADNDCDLLAAYDTICEELSHRYPQLVIHLGQLCGQVQGLSHSLAIAQSFDGEDDDLTTASVDGSDMIEEMKKQIKSGNEAQALARLRERLARIDLQASFMLRRYLLVELVHQLLALGRDFSCRLNAEEIINFMKHQDQEALEESMVSIVRKLCSMATNTAAPLTPSAQLIIDYIEQHATEYDICLDSVATACDVSTKQISRVVRSAAGMSFKEYISQLRMQKARELLKSGLSATETAQQVGYSDISYFSKVFRAYVGCTTSQFKDSPF